MKPGFPFLLTLLAVCAPFAARDLRADESAGAHRFVHLTEWEQVIICDLGPDVVELTTCPGSLPIRFRVGPWGDDERAPAERHRLVERLRSLEPKFGAKRPPLLVELFLPQGGRDPWVADLRTFDAEPEYVSACSSGSPALGLTAEQVKALGTPAEFQRRLGRVTLESWRALAEGRPPERVIELLGLPEGEDEVRRILRDPSEAVVLAALRVIAAHRQGPAAEVAALLPQSTPAVRREALGTLRALRAVGQVEAVARVLRDPDATTRAAAVRALSEMEAAAQAPALVDCLRDPEPSVRQATLYALARIRPAGVRAAIEPLKRDPDAEVRRLAEWALSIVRS